MRNGVVHSAYREAADSVDTKRFLVEIGEGASLELVKVPAGLIANFKRRMLLAFDPNSAVLNGFHESPRNPDIYAVDKSGCFAIKINDSELSRIVYPLHSTPEQIAAEFGCY